MQTYVAPFDQTAHEDRVAAAQAGYDAAVAKADAAAERRDTLITQLAGVETQIGSALTALDASGLANLLPYQAALRQTIAVAESQWAPLNTQVNATRDRLELASRHLENGLAKLQLGAAKGALESRYPGTPTFRDSQDRS